MHKENKPISIWGGVVQLTLTRPLNQSAERMAKDTWFTKFMNGVTFFHIAGIALLLGGAHYGKPSQVGGKIFDNFDLTFTVTFTQIVGAVTFFYEVIKARFKKSPEAK